MCGRFTLRTPEAGILQAFDVAPATGLVPRYNITPSQEIPVVRDSGTGRELTLARWGLVPGWSKQAQPKYSTINARVESVAEKPAYRTAFKHRRCLIPADGFFEWQQAGDKKKIPHYIHLPDDSVFAFAGLWEHWQGEEGAFDSCAIITLPARGIMATIHSRMPAMISAVDYTAWLDTALNDKRDIMPLLGSSSSDQLEAYAVSSYVNSPQHTDARCIERA